MRWAVGHRLSAGSDRDLGRRVESSSRVCNECWAGQASSTRGSDSSAVEWWRRAVRRRRTTFVVSACSKSPGQFINSPGAVPIGAVPVGPTLVWPGGGTTGEDCEGPVPYGGGERPASCQHVQNVKHKLSTNLVVCQ